MISKQEKAEMQGRAFHIKSTLYPQTYRSDKMAYEAADDVLRLLSWVDELKDDNERIHSLYFAEREAHNSRGGA